MNQNIILCDGIRDKQIEKRGECLSIVIGEYDGRQAAFLLQNMFPITEKYLDHIHTRNGNPVPVKHSIAQEVRTNMQKLRQLIYRGKQVVFPDVRRLEKLMLEELQEAKRSVEQQRPSVLEKLNRAKQEAAALNSAPKAKKPHNRDAR